MSPEGTELWCTVRTANSPLKYSVWLSAAQKAGEGLGGLDVRGMLSSIDEQRHTEGRDGHGQTAERTARGAVHRHGRAGQIARPPVLSETQRAVVRGRLRPLDRRPLPNVLRHRRKTWTAFDPARR